MQYKFENYRDPNFPLYCSAQQGKGQLVKPHFHNAYELLWVIRGEGELLVNTRKLTVRENEVYYIPPNCIHSLFSRQEQTQIRGVVFEKSLFHDRSLPPFWEDALSAVNVPDVCFAGQDGPVQAELAQLHRSYSENTCWTKMELLSRLYRVMCLLLQHYGGGGEQKVACSRIAPVIEYLQKNYPKKIGLSELSGLVYLCDDHLIRLFKDHTGKTPIRFLTDLRLENAMKLLAQSKLSVAEIAFRVGFSDASYMCKICKQTIGMTPNQYRKTRNQ